MQASLHPGATGFGWFFRYLTFYSFSLQIVQLAIAAVADLLDQARDLALFLIIDVRRCVNVIPCEVILSASISRLFSAGSIPDVLLHTFCSSGPIFCTLLAHVCGRLGAN